MAIAGGDEPPWIIAFLDRIEQMFNDAVFNFTLLRRTVNIQKSKEVHRKRSRIVCLVRNAKVLLSYGCNNEPTEAAVYSYTSNEIRTIYFCWPCYRTLEKDRIIENGKVIKL